MRKAEDYGGDQSDVVTTVLVFGVIVGLIVWYVCRVGDDQRDGLILTATLSAVVGWVAGILTTPYNTAEAGRLGQVAQVAYAALGGYVLAKVDKVIDAALLTTDSSKMNMAALPYLAVGITMFLAASVLCYVTRSYVSTQQSKPKGS